MDTIRFDHSIYPTEIRRRGGLVPALAPHGAQPGRRWQRVEVRGVEEARHTLCVLRDQAWQLRALLAGDAFDATRLDDDSVIDAVAIRLERGDYLLFCCRDIDVGTAAGAARPDRPGAPARADDARQAPAARARLVSPAPPRVVPEQAEPAPAAAIDEDAQAATLRRAARSGVPFCEICEQRARARRGLS